MSLLAGEVVTELEKIVVSVAKALDLAVSYRQWSRVVLHYDGSNVFHPHWRARCEDYLLTRGDITLHKTGAHWFFEPSIHNRDQIEISCPANEFFARAIHELISTHSR